MAKSTTAMADSKTKIRQTRLKRTRLFCSLVTALLFSHCGTKLVAQPLLSIQSGVELSWPTSNSITYQPQWSANAGSNWTSLGGIISGNGLTNTLFDPASGRMYRVLEMIPGTPPVSATLSNGGFEFGSGSVASNWSVTTAAGGPVYGVRTNNSPRTGAFHFEVRLASVGAGPVVEFQQTGVPVTGGTTYPFTFYSKALTGSAGHSPQWRIFWNVGGETGYQGFTPGNNTYTLVSNSVTAPAAATAASIILRVAGAAIPSQSATIQFDDVALGSGVASPGSPGVTNILVPAVRAISKISWPTISGTEYQPESTTNLAMGIWSNIPPAIIGDGGTKTITLPLARSAEFVRLKTPGAVEVPTNFVPLFNAGTPLEPATSIDTPMARYTYIADRARDRHAREANFNSYDHYLSWYWEQRMANIEIIDRVGKAGQPQTITFNYTTHDLLNPAEFRTFFRGIGTVAEYNNNQVATLVSTNASATPGEIDYNYTATITANAQFNRALQLGDRVEIEISLFLNAPRHGRNNYYGTTLLYIVGQGIVPWIQGNDIGLTGGIIGNVNQNLDSYPLSTNGWLGGLTTLPYQYSNEPEHRFKQLAGNIAPTNGLRFMLGRRLHHTDFGDGSHSEAGNPAFTEHVGKLGPKFIARSCVECHVNNGRALPATVGTPLTKWVFKVGNDANGSPHPTLGSVLQPQSTSGQNEGSVSIGSYTTNNGQYGDATAYSLRKPNYVFSGTTPAFFSARIAPQLVGLGLLEAVGETNITALADPGDANADGISGRIQTVIDPQTGQHRLGRFGYKGVKARVSHQIAAALNSDLGVATTIFPVLDGETNSSALEINATELDLMTRYVALLGVGARRDLTNAQALQGEQLFASANCVKCHTPTLTTSPYHPNAELRNQTIHPYTDLLLHDMGPGLADNMGEGVASGSEWRTAPLWNIGLTAGVSGGEAYLHDGRARSLEEAILWHGGEAESSKEVFRTMSASDRAALIKFLKSL
jgi:CxxC motif-containing protein (DUF1111 family)